VAVAKCRLCGREVCKKHLGSRGYCVVCEDLMCRVCGERLSVTSCVYCGKLVCRECSIEVEPGIRACLDCYVRYRGKRFKTRT